MSPAIPFHEISSAAVLGVGERLTEAPSRLLTDIAFSRELQAQQGLTRAIGWVDLSHTMTLAERGIIPRDSARALVAALLALDKAPSNDEAMGRALGPEQMSALDKLVLDGVATSQSQIFAFNPKMSFVSKEMKAADPFWR